MKYLIILISFSLYAENYQDKRLQASNLAKDFFGTISIKEKKDARADFGSVGANFEATVKCGRIDILGSVIEEIKNLEGQAKALATQIIGQFTNVNALALGLICYYKPTVCSYIRDTKIDFRQALKLELDGCRAIDSYIDKQASKGAKDSFAKDYANCIGDNPTTARLRNCQKNTTSKTRNLANPLSEELMTSSQNVLKSILTAAQRSSSYDLLVPLLGEIKLNHSGYWYQIFPQKVQSPSDLVTSFIDEGVIASCDTRKLKDALSKRWDNKPSNLQEYVQFTIKDYLVLEDIEDLDSLPASDRVLACDHLGKSIAKESVEKMSADAPGILSVALQNNALPEDIRDLLLKKSELTFLAITKTIDNKKITPLKITLKNIRLLAYEYRKDRRQEASTISAKKILNTDQNSCTDQLSCESN